MTIDAAHDLIGHCVTIVDGTEDICLGKALGRVLADPVSSRSMSPPFDNAAMDGFAFSSAALRGDGPWVLDVAARIQAGQCSAMSLVDREWTEHGGHAARFLFATASRPSRTAALVTATL